MARRKAPTNPAAVTQARLDRAEREAEVARLEKLGATVTTDPARRVVSAYRSNVFNLLKDRGTINQGHMSAATDGVKLWAAWKGLEGKPDWSAAKVDNGSTAPHNRALVTDRQLRAGKVVARLLAHLGEPSATLFTAFMVATVEEDRPMVWRSIVHINTGETNERHQTALVVAMLDQLAAFYQAPREVRAA